MKRSRLNIWAVQGVSSDIYPALENVESSPKNILFQNCLSYLRLGSRKIDIQFDTIFYCEEADKLILIMQDGAVSKEELKHILATRKIEYNEVSFLNYEKDKTNPPRELWFARDPYVLKDALKDSRRQGIETADYYPDVKGRLEFRYPLSDRGLDAFDYQGIKGVVILEDKIVILLSNGQQRNVNFQSAIKTFAQTDVIPNLYLDEKEIPPAKLQKVYKKKP